MRNNLKEEVKNKGKPFVFLVFILGLIVITITISLTVGSLVKTLVRGDKSLLYYGIIHKSGRFFTILGSLASYIVFVLAIIRNPKINGIFSSDDATGVDYKGKGTYGTSRWMLKKEAAKVYTLGYVEDAIENIYGQYGKYKEPTDGNEVISYKKPEVGGEGDRNVIVIGSPGTGKSVGIISNSILQARKREDSMIITDPSGELYEKFAGFLYSSGYDIKLLNFVDPSESDCWNCAEEVISSETEMIDGTRLNEFVNIYMANASTGKEEAYWRDCGDNLLCFVIGFCAYRRDTYIFNKLTQLLEKISDKDDQDDMDMLAYFNKKAYTIKEEKSIIISTAIKNNYNQQEVEKIITNIEKSAPPLTIKEIFKTLINFNEIEKQTNKFSIVDSDHFIMDLYKIYSSNENEKAKTSALQGLQVKFKTLAADKKILNVLSTDGIKTREINKKKTACFIVQSDTSTTYKPIASLFFSFVYKNTQAEWDKEIKIAERNGTKMPCRPVEFLLDEFNTLGVIGGDPNKFPNYLATSRKRKLHNTIIIQSYLMLEEIYGKNNANVIQGCCSTLVYLGGNDPATVDFISKFASGEATVETESHQEISSLLTGSTIAGNQMNVGSAKRMLLTPDEARRWNNQVLLVRRGEHPLKLNPFLYFSHPYYEESENTKRYKIDLGEQRNKTKSAINDVSETLVDGMIQRLEMSIKRIETTIIQQDTKEDQKSQETKQNDVSDESKWYELTSWNEAISTEQKPEIINDYLNVDEIEFGEFEVYNDDVVLDNTCIEQEQNAENKILESKVDNVSVIEEKEKNQQNVEPKIIENYQKSTESISDNIRKESLTTFKKVNDNLNNNQQFEQTKKQIKQNQKSKNKNKRTKEKPQNRVYNIDSGIS